MLKSESINELATALAKAQGQMTGAKKKSDNPYFKSKYADLAEILETIRAPMADNGLCICQLVQPDPENAVVETLLAHTSGQWLSSIISLKPAKCDPQGMGSAITYARRYSLAAIVGITQEDDDGEKAMGRKPEQRATDPKPIEQLSRKAISDMISTQLKQLGWDSAQGKAHRLSIMPDTTNASKMTDEQLKDWLDALMIEVEKMIANAKTAEDEIPTLKDKCGIICDEQGRDVDAEFKDFIAGEPQGPQYELEQWRRFLTVLSMKVE